jgi:ABC-type branched-subunit amino acid transport system ATPase component
MSGFLTPDSGKVFIGERRVDALPSFRRARLGLARTWQNTRLFGSLTVMDNLLMATRDYPGESLLNIFFRPGRVHATNKASLDRARNLLGRIGLADRGQALPSELSYGQQKLVGLARALMNDGTCLLLDEPMAGVEGRTYDRIREIVAEEASSGKSICVVEHNIAFVRDICDSAVFMFNGRIIASGTVAELTSSRHLTDLYFGA